MSQKTMYAKRSFKDAGTARSFAAGQPVENVTDGEMLNYVAAGLVGDQPPAEPDERDAERAVTPVGTDGAPAA